MKYIVKKWKTIMLIYMIIAFITLISILKLPFETLIYAYAPLLLLTCILHFGYVLSIIGYIIHLITRRLDLALPLYEKAYKMGTTHRTSIALYALNLMKNNQLEKAINIYLDLQKMSLSTQIRKVVICNLGVCYWKLGELTTGIEYFQKVLDDPIMSKIITADDYTTLGYIYIQKGDFEAGRSYTTKALDMIADYPPAMDNLGQLSYQQGDFDEAEKFFEIAIKGKNLIVDSNYYMGRIAQARGNLDLARSYYETALKGNITALNTVTRELIQSQIAQLDIK